MSVEEPLREAILRAAARAFARGLKGELDPPRGVVAPPAEGDGGMTTAGEEVPAREPLGRAPDGGVEDVGAPSWEDEPLGPPWGTVRVLPVADLGGEPAAVGGREKKDSGGGWSGGGMSSPRAAAAIWYSVHVVEKSCSPRQKGASRLSIYCVLMMS